jgi:hypothetical protein
MQQGNKNCTGFFKWSWPWFRHNTSWHNSNRPTSTHTHTHNTHVMCVDVISLPYVINNIMMYMCHVCMWHNNLPMLPRTSGLSASSFAHCKSSYRSLRDSSTIMFITAVFASTKFMLIARNSAFWKQKYRKMLVSQFHVGMLLLSFGIVNTHRSIVSRTVLLSSAGRCRAGGKVRAAMVQLTCVYLCHHLNYW